MKIKQYFIMLLAVLAVGAVLLCTQAKAATVAEGTCGNGVTWVLDDTGLLTISGTGAMEDFGPYIEPAPPTTDITETTGSTEATDATEATGTTETTEVTAAPGLDPAPAPWYAHKASITSVVVGDGITAIGAYAFADCTALTQITIVDTVTIIGEAAFSDCTSLKYIIFGESSQHQPTTPDTPTLDTTTPDATVPNTTEQGTTVSDITVPDTRTVGMKNVLPAFISSIGPYAFSGCTSLTNIVLTDYIATLETGIFSGCTALEDITLPVGLVSVGDNAFMGCTGLKFVHYAGDENQWNAITIGAENGELTRARFQTLCNHTFDAGVVTKEATCGAEGETTYTCSLCQFANIEPIAITQPHTFGKPKKVNNTNHKIVCSVCKYEEQSAHNWNEGVVQREVTCGHTGITVYTCNDCKGTKQVTSAKLKNHTYDNDCDGTCNICSYVRRTTHTFGTEWVTDDTGHWHVCTGCSKKSEVLHHTWDAEELCVDCKLPNPHVHSFGTDWISNANSHWHGCECGKTADEAPHSYGSDYLCTACGAEDPNKPKPTQPPTEPMYPTPEPPTPMDMTIVIILAAMMVSAGGLIVFLLLKKKS